jgi:uncharacterized membrane protein
MIQWQASIGGATNVVTDRYPIGRSKQFVRGKSTMKKKFLGMLTLLFFVILTTAALAQTTAPSDEGTRPGPGMMYGQSQSQDPGQGQSTYGPGMLGGQGQGQGAYGPGMMYGYGAGWMGGYGGIWAVILLVILVAGLVAWIFKRKGQLNKM